MKIGYLRKDDDGHNYVVPEELIEEFDFDWEELMSTESEDAYYKAIEQWNNKWWQYALGESPYNLKILLEK